MKLTKTSVSKDGLKMQCELQGSEDSFVNTIRRMILEEVPTLAVEDVEIRENSSALFDEMLALRLGLIPIKTDLSSYGLPESESDLTERSAKCHLQIELKASKKGTVYAKDAKSKDPNCTFVHADMPVDKLIEKQKLDCTLWAVMGQGKEHIKWAPGHLWYAQNSKLTVKNDVKLLEEFKDSFPTAIFDKSGKISEKLILENDLVDAVDRICDDLVKVQYQEGSYTLKLESWGQLDCKEIFVTAAQMLGEKAKQMAALL